ncbi:hypothetical protein ERO13_D01G111001v2 [Gossypium hirsutum]|nr:hypothetical protein ERO13_D01G111001v2 [Gossypium hirsutum]
MIRLETGYCKGFVYSKAVEGGRFNGSDDGARDGPSSSRRYNQTADGSSVSQASETSLLELEAPIKICRRHLNIF